MKTSAVCGIHRFIIRLFVCLTLAAVFVPAGMAQELFTNALSKIKYTERVKRTVKFVHPGPIIGDYALLQDRGNFSFQATLDTTGINFFDIDRETGVRVLFNPDDEGPDFRFFLGQDSKFKVGSRVATLKSEAEFGTGDVVIRTMTVKFNPGNDTMRIKITGRYYAARVAPNTLIEQAGELVLAGPEIGTPDHDISEIRFIEVRLVIGDDEKIVRGIAPVVIAGKVKNTPRVDKEIGTYNAFNIAIVGRGQN